MKPLLVLAVLMAAGMLASGCGGGEASALQSITIHYSKFEPVELTVPAGKPVTISVRNDDPIGHEWIVGSAAVHATHRTGTEAVHAGVPSEVTIPAYETRETTMTFTEPGEYLYICHLPGHEAYGMVGTLHVVENDG